MCIRDRNGSSGATGGGETVVVQEQQQTVTGTGYDTNGQFVFEVYNNSAYDIYALYIGVINASSDHDIDVLPQILPANSSTTIVGQATMGDWSQTEWTLYVELSLIHISMEFERIPQTVRKISPLPGI